MGSLLRLRVAAAVVTALSGSGSVAGCRDEVPPRTRPSDPDAGITPDKPMTRQAVESVKVATAAATRLSQSLGRGEPSRPDYLALRRAVAALMPFARGPAPVGAEVLWGPPKAGDEGGGALGKLDRALAAGDITLAKAPMEQCLRALRLIDNELMLHQVKPEPAVRGLSEASFELGLMLMEAYAGVPDGPDAVLADLKGMLDGLERGAAAALAVAAPAQRSAAAPAFEAFEAKVKALRTALDGAAHSHALTGRARWVRVSGELGVAARRLAAAFGVKTALPYPARYPTADNAPEREVVTPLVVPAPRRDPRQGDHAAIAALGHDLFRDKRLSKGAVRACSDCHRLDAGLSDGRATPPSLDPTTPITRNTPTLWYAPLHGAQLWDGQFASAERQALKVIHSRSEMGLTTDELVAVVSAIADFNARFSQLFDDGVTAENVARSLVAYETRDFVPATAPLDRFARGDEAALTEEVALGFDVFVGVGRCARCHVPPLFGGSRPTDFATAVYAAIGVPIAPDDPRIDPDRGRGRVTEHPLDEHAFKTPTVRNVAHTAPFFHNGAYPTLELVVDFYVKGGGAGLGLGLDNLDPEVRKLELSDADESALLAFMREGLTDATAR